jgi:hypothetical protein
VTESYRGVAPDLDLEALSGVATLVVPHGWNVKRDVQGLYILSAKADGVENSARYEQGWVTLPVPGRTEAVTVEIARTFIERTATAFVGWMPAHGLTFVWPDSCRLRRAVGATTGGLRRGRERGRGRSCPPSSLSDSERRVFRRREGGAMAGSCWSTRRWSAPRPPRNTWRPSSPPARSSTTARA